MSVSKIIIHPYFFTDDDDEQQLHRLYLNSEVERLLQSALKEAASTVLMEITSPIIYVNKKLAASKVLLCK